MDDAFHGNEKKMDVTCCDIRADLQYREYEGNRRAGG